MRRRPPKPLRFVGIVLALWICARTAVLAPEWWIKRGVAAPLPEASAARGIAAAAPAQPMPAAVASRIIPSRPPPIASAAQAAGAALPMPVAVAPASTPLPFIAIERPAAPASAAAALPLPREAGPRSARAGRWSGSAWLLVRDDRERSLAPGGTLGGSQSGVRIAYRLNGDSARPLSLSGRLYTPLGNRRGAEAAAGVDWRPIAGLPVNLLAERRQALARGGRSAFSLTLHGGVSERRLPGGARLDAYAQAGVVGARSRDLFADGGARISLPAGRASLGAGLWGGAQPGAARLDAGPHASVRLPVAGESLRLAAEWRFRIAGDARPGSGPVLSLGSDF